MTVEPGTTELLVYHQTQGKLTRLLSSQKLHLRSTVTFQSFFSFFFTRVGSEMTDRMEPESVEAR